MIRKGTEVSWDWGDGTATGKVEKTVTDTLTRTIKGSAVTRHGTKNDPALLIRQEDGSGVLKLRSEVERA
jgi:hypothetical protein